MITGKALPKLTLDPENRSVTGLDVELWRCSQHEPVPVRPVADVRKWRQSGHK